MAAILPFLPAIIGAAGAIGGGLLGRKKKKETKIQKTQRRLIDDLLRGVEGDGKFANLFSANEADFNKMYREPALQRFRQQTAPQIQQSFVASGQHRGTGLEDALTRAGVDLEGMLNQGYNQFVQGAENRKAQTLGSILGGSAGASEDEGFGEAAGAGLAGYLGGKGFRQDIGGILGEYPGGDRENDLTDLFQPARKGFEKDPFVYNPFSGIQTGGY